MNHTLRTTSVGLGLGGAGVSLLALAPSPAATRATLDHLAAGSTSAESGLVALLGMVGWLCLLWLVSGAVLSVAGALPGAVGRLAARAARRVAPAVVRRAVEAAMGVSLVTGTLGATSAYADPPLPVHSAAPVLGDVGPFDRPVSSSSGATSEPGRAASAAPVPSASPSPAGPAAVITVAPGDGSFLIEIPSAAPQVPGERPTPAATPRGPRVAADPALVTGPVRPRDSASSAEVVVRRGDTLWGLAAARLGADAGAREIDAEWRRWYAANRAVIGADPNLILPGQRLTAPAATAAPTTRSTR